MTRFLPMIVAVSILAAPTAFAAEETAADRAPPEKAPSLMTPTEIKAYNTGLAETHPYYIKCRKSLELGSLVKKNRVCRTNEQWKVAIAKGSDNARDTAERMQSVGGTISN